jgi:hypothetical protein
MLKPNENKKDWFLFHMTPLGMGQGNREKAAGSAPTDSTRIALLLVLGVLVIGMFLAAYLGT